MKKLFFISFLFVTAQIAVYSQSKGLSEEGYKHWVKAVARMENVKQKSDYFLVVDEFLKVLETDSLYADTYYNLGKIYTKIGELEESISYFNKAKDCYEKYLVLKPSEKNTIIKELALLEIKVEDCKGDNNLIGKDLGSTTWYNAKNMCEELKAEGFDDWYLPSKDELVIFFQTEQKDFNVNNVNVGMYYTGGGSWYWSSTEIDDKKAYNVTSIGWVSDENKNKKGPHCLCIRKKN